MLFAQINKKAKADFDKLVDEIEYALRDPKGWEKKTQELWEKIKAEREGEVNE